MLVVVSSPSGGGKGTLINYALEKVPGLGYSVSFTTRPPRAGEVDGRDYFFVSCDTFKAMEEAGSFVESAIVHGNLYGTSKAQVAQELSNGRDIVLEIDVQGAASVRRLVADSVSIFILPPSFEILRSRLFSRGSEAPDQLAVRLANARGEVEHYREFDYVVINDDAVKAGNQLASIIFAERARRERQEREIDRVVESFPKQL
jgi:guanylate kinase